MSSLKATAKSIQSMQIRGAAAIGVAAARALADHVQDLPDQGLQARAVKTAQLLDAARPTAVTLHNALGWVLASMKVESTPKAKRRAARDGARLVEAEVKESRKAIARHGAEQLPDDSVILTHCNSSTALAVLEAAVRAGKTLEVIATETRPFGQGELTVRALAKAKIPCALVVDSAVEHVLATRDIDAVLVGADTVAADGSLFNKIGTAGVAALASTHDVPFYSAAGLHKFTTLTPAKVPIEDRGAAEVLGDRRLPKGVQVLNPVFDRTIPENVSGYITETGLRSPRLAVQQNLPRLVDEGAWT